MHMLKKLPVGAQKREKEKENEENKKNIVTNVNTTKVDINQIMTQEDNSTEDQDKKDKQQLPYKIKSKLTSVTVKMCHGQKNSGIKTKLKNNHGKCENSKSNGDYPLLNKKNSMESKIKSKCKSSQEINKKKNVQGDVLQKVKSFEVGNIGEKKKKRKEILLNKKKKEETGEVNDGNIKKTIDIEINRFGPIKENEKLDIIKKNNTFKEKSLICTVDGKPEEKFQMTPEEIIETSKKLQSFHWYYGLIPRDQIDDILVEHGQFIVRKSEMKNRTRFVLSVNDSGKSKRHIMLNYKDGKWFFKDIQKVELWELLNFYIENNVPIPTLGVYLKKPVPRPLFYYLHESINIQKKIGEGAFGEVSEGIFKDNNSNTISCAIKILKGKLLGKIDRQLFIAEAEIQKNFNHPNIIRLLGIAPFDEPIMILLELAPGGALKSSLKKRPYCHPDQLCDYAFEALKGLRYLHAHNVIHRDLAARNCLLGTKNEVKISDFGLTVLNRNCVKVENKCKLPIRWLAPETLREKIFTQKTDIFSYGILLWEIFTCCQTDPYPHLTNGQVKELTLSDRPNLQPLKIMPFRWADTFIKAIEKNVNKRLSAEELYELVADNKQN